MNTYPRPAELAAMLDASEEILWEGRPQKASFILNKALYSLFAMLPIVLLVVLSGLRAIAEYRATGNTGRLQLTAALAFPLVCWVFYVGALPLKWAKEYYLTTTQRAIICSGFIGRKVLTLFYSNVLSVTLNIDSLHKVFNTSNIDFDTGKTRRIRNGGVVSVTDAFCDIDAAAARALHDRIKNSLPIAGMPL